MKKLFVFILVGIFLVNLSSLSSGEKSSQLKTIENNIVIDHAGGNCAVLIGGATKTPDDRTAVDLDIGKAFRLFTDKSYSIMKFNSEKLATKNELKEVITTWLPDNLGDECKCVIYISAHGNKKGEVWLNYQGQMLKANELASWLNEIKGHYSICTVILETCYAGSFIPCLSDENRIIVTSSDEDSKSYYFPSVGGFFSYSFFYALEYPNQLEISGSYGEAWDYSESQIDKSRTKERLIIGLIKQIFSKIYKPPNVSSWRIQNPQIDDNGDGTGHGTNKPDTLPLGGDGYLALNTYP